MLLQLHLGHSQLEWSCMSSESFDMPTISPAALDNFQHFRVDQSIINVFALAPGRDDLLLAQGHQLLGNVSLAQFQQGLEMAHAGFARPDGEQDLHAVPGCRWRPAGHRFFRGVGFVCSYSKSLNILYAHIQDLECDRCNKFGMSNEKTPFL